jgi:hypothetical protein
MQSILFLSRLYDSHIKRYHLQETTFEAANLLSNNLFS